MFDSLGGFFGQETRSLDFAVLDQHHHTTDTTAEQRVIGNIIFPPRSHKIIQLRFSECTAVRKRDFCLGEYLRIYLIFFFKVNLWLEILSYFLSFKFWAPFLSYLFIYLPTMALIHCHKAKINLKKKTGTWGIVQKSGMKKKVKPGISTYFGDKKYILICRFIIFSHKYATIVSIV